MRLRSSHFVFVVVLLCSVQIRDNFTLQLVNGEVSRRSSGASQRHGITALPASAAVTHGGSTTRLTVPTRLDPAGWTAYRVAWTMPLPAHAAAAVSNHTSLLRA
jgi:hypothetical protein